LQDQKLNEHRPNRYLAKRLYKINKASTAIASAKIKESIITINILAEAEGFLATDFTATEPTKAITAAGPAVLKNMIKIRAKVDIFSS